MQNILWFDGYFLQKEIDELRIQLFLDFSFFNNGNEAEYDKKTQRLKELESQKRHRNI